MGAILATLPLAAPGVAETFVGANIDSRLVIALDVDDAAAQEWLPEGWTLAPLPGGALAGADLLIVMIDQQVGYDAEGNIADPATRRVAVMVHPATGGDDEFRVFVTRSYITSIGGDPYKSEVEAAVSREAEMVHVAGEPRRSREAWAVSTDDDGTLTVTLDHVVGQPEWSDSEAMPYSAVDPEFHRIYRIEQLAELVMSAPLGVEIDGAVTVATTIPEIAPMFDGAEQIVAVVSIPVYVRDIYLP